MEFVQLGSDDPGRLQQGAMDGEDAACVVGYTVESYTGEGEILATQAEPADPEAIDEELNAYAADNRVQPQHDSGEGEETVMSGNREALSRMGWMLPPG